MSNENTRDRQGAASVILCILTVIGVILLAGLVYLIIGGILSGIGVPMWITGIIQPNYGHPAAEQDRDLRGLQRPERGGACGHAGKRNERAGPHGESTFL